MSIVTPSLNQGWSLERTIRSVLDQEYPRLEYIVQDGGSTDDSVEILQRYSSRLHHWESARDPGQGAAINAGFKRATGEIMAYLNADDVLLPGSLTRVARHFARHPETDVVYGHRVLLDRDDNEIGRWLLPRHDDEVIRWVDFVPQETLFWRRRVWDAVGGVDDSLTFAIDWDLILRFQEAGARFVRLPRFLGALRVHDEQKLDTLRGAGAQEAEEIRRRVHGRAVTQAETLSNVWMYLVKHIAIHRLYRMGLLRY
jgi:glycosyltransferase involved in cell wall biosynthesis